MMRQEQSAAAGGRVPVPVDRNLAGLEALLDASRMGAAALERLLAPGSRLRTCRPVYVRYKPGTNAIVAFELDYDDPSGASARLRFHGKTLPGPEHTALVEKLATKRWVERDGIRPWAALEAERAVLFAFPNDPGLDGLRLLSHPKKIQRALYDHGALEPVDHWRISDRRLALTTVRHKPEKRAVTRVDTRAVHRSSGERRDLRVYLRTYQDDRGATMHAFMRQLAGALDGTAAAAVPRSIGYLPDRRTLLVANAPGRALSHELTGPEAAVATARTAAALARLHACPATAVAAIPPSRLLDAARDTGRTVAQLIPELAAEVDALLAALEARARELAPAAPQVVHGDFHPEQVLLTDARVTLLDFDRAYLGDPAADAGNFRANLQLLARDGAVTAAEDLADRFDAAYAEAAGAMPSAARRRFWHAHGLLQLTVAPFRVLSASWPAEVAELVSACREVLS